MENALLQRAGLLIQHRRFTDAAEVLSQSLSLDPNNPDALRLLGICQYSREDFRSAAMAFEHAIATAPEEADLRVWLARCALSQKRYAEALLSLEAAQALDPDLSEVHSARAMVFYNQTKWAEAEVAAQAALELDADDEDAQNILSHALLMQGRQEEGDAHIQHRFSRNPENEYTHVAAGYAALRRGAHEEAAGHFQEALRLNPELDAAREGMLTSFRARSVIYRSFLAFSFKVAQLQRKYRQWLFIGAFVVYKLVVAALEPVSPALATLVVVLYALFVLWSYVAQGIGTLFILGDRRARLALKRREMAEGILVGGGALTGLAIVLASLFLPVPKGVVSLGIGLAAMSIPWSLSLGTDNRSGQFLYGCFALGASVGVLMILAGNFYPEPSVLRSLGLLLTVVCSSIPTFLALFGVKRG